MARERVSTRRVLWILTLVIGASDLASGVTLTGRVVGPTGTPVANVDLDLDDATTGQPIVTPGDHTNAQGVFSFAVPTGTYNIAFIAPFADRLADKKIFNVTVSGNTNLGDTVLGAGLLITGHVIGPAGGDLVNVDQDVDDSFTGDRIPTNADHTNANGVFQFLVPAGTRDFLILPVKTDRRVARTLTGVVVTGDTNLGTIQCQQGFLLSGRVTGPGGGGVAAADINVYDESTGALVPTVGDNTDAAGNYTVVVPTGSFTLDFEPPIGLGLAHRQVTGVQVSADRSLNASLTATPIGVGISRSGRLALAGTTYSYIVNQRNTTASPQTFNMRVNGFDPISGASKTLIGPSTQTLPASFGPQSTTYSLRIPANVRARFRGRPLDLVVVVTDSASGAVLDSDVTQFTIR